jgi:signal transduction histidine kinase/ligand-binding sensor domain-containing protein
VLLLSLSAGRLAAQSALGLGDIQVLSPTISVRVWTIANGLPQSAVTELESDSSGYVWGGTFGGLFRFDGHSIRRYTSADLPALSSNSVTALALDPTGLLLVGTPAGAIIRLREGRFVDSVPLPPVRTTATGVDDIQADLPSEIWIRRGEWVQRYVDGRWDARLPFKGTTTLVRNRIGTLYYAGPDGIIRVGRDGVATVAAAQPSPGDGVLIGIHVDQRGRVWVGGNDGMWVYEEGNGPARRVPGTMGRVNAITSDSTGTVWFAANEQLYRYAANDIATARPPEAVMNVRAIIASMSTTRDGLVLLGSLEGMVLVRTNSVRVVESRRAIPGVETGSLASPGDGTVWLASGCSDALRIDQEARLMDSVPRPHPIGCTRSLRLDARGRLWLGGDGALRRLDADRRQRVWRVDSSGQGLGLIRPLVTSGDSLLFGMSDGRLGVVRGNDSVYFHAQWRERTGKPVESMVLTGDGVLWVAQSGRLTRMQRGATQTFDARQRIPGAVPRALHADSGGGLWIGTYGAGLWYFRPGAAARPVPVVDQTVSAIIDGPDERLWMPGNRGISVVGLGSLRQWVADSALPPDVRLLSYEEGVPEGNVGYPAATAPAPGLLAFASITGLVVARTRDVVTSGVTPAVQVDAVRSSSGPIPVVGGVYRVTPENRSLYVTVTMPSFRFADVAQFRYRLGTAGPWITLGSERELRLSIDEPGLVQLTVEGRVPGGAWSRATPISLDVVPLYSELWWPRVLLGAILLVMALAIARQRVRVLEAAARAREVELQARRDAVELAARHQREIAQVGRVAVAGELTASLSHELGQPLAAIVNNAEVARRLLMRSGRPGEPANAAVEEALLDVIAQGRRASQVVREFRRFLKREHGERERLPVQELIESVTLLLRQEFDQRRVHLRVHVGPGIPALNVERVLVQQVLVNVLQNACDAARPSGDGEVLVRARRSGEGVRISVVDNGAGFAGAVRQSAFEPFVTTRRDGMGMGLAIARRIVESHGGRIAVGRLPAAGAVVSLWLPTSHAPADASDRLVPSQVTTHA